MIRCGFHRVNLRLNTRSKQLIGTPRVTSKCAPVILRRWNSHGQQAAERSTASRYQIFNRIQRPAPGDVASWSALLDLALPVHLRREAQHAGDPGKITSGELAEILLAAQRQTVPANGIDLLYHIGLEEGRWSAVVWLVKRLVDSFAPEITRPFPLSKTVTETGEPTPLRLSEMTTKPIFRPARKGFSSTAAAAAKPLKTLLDLTDVPQLERSNIVEWMPKDALGQIWRTLGRMTIACADGEIKPEILEIIAFLHHKELMPMSIYNSKPSMDAMQIQQPPMLNLFSSRILTSLSDAAWRAHQKLVIEEAKANSGDDTAVRPEVSGSAYRVRIAGLRPEVWLELILWASLHGGWVVEGTEILLDIHREPKSRLWKAYSWRSFLSDEQQAEADWNKLEYAFNTNPSSTSGGVDTAYGVSVRRTISSEVVNAYVDALPSVVRSGYGRQGCAPGKVLSYLTALRGLLRRSSLTLSAGSWNSVVLRFVDAQASVMDRFGQLEELAALAPIFGEELNAHTRQELPSYVFDGNALTLGIAHQALRSRIASGDMEGSMRLLRMLQTRTDRNKHQSLMDFLNRLRQRPAAGAMRESELFTNNFAGIEYPAFDVQVPPTLLGPLLELVMDADALDVAKWMVYNTDIDGPIIPLKMYRDPAVTPALVRFATETNDEALLARIISGPSKSRPYESKALTLPLMQRFLDSEISRKRWGTVVRLLTYIRDQDNMSWNMYNLAMLAKTMLFQVQGAEAGDSECMDHLTKSSEIFKDMIEGRYEGTEGRGVLQHKITLLLTILASADASWAHFCLRLQPLKGFYSFTLIPNRVFDLLLQGIISAYGSERGRRVLDIFWPSNAQEPSKMVFDENFADDVDESSVPKNLQSASDDAERQRIVVKFPDHPDERVIVYRGLQPNILTIRIILEKALREYRKEDKLDRIPSSPPASTSGGVGAMKAEDFFIPELAFQSNVVDADYREPANRSPGDTIAWSVRCLRSMNMEERDIRALVEKRLSPEALQDLGAEYPDLLQGRVTELEDGAETEQEQKSSEPEV